MPRMMSQERSDESSDENTIPVRAKSSESSRKDVKMRNGGDVSAAEASDDSDHGKRAQRKSKAKSEEKAVRDEVEEEDEDEEEGDEEDDGEEYIVEAIEAHDWFPEDEQWRYKTKWQGYPDESDRTWEPREHLEGALDMLQEYWDGVGFEPEAKYPHGPGKKRGRKSLHSDGATPGRGSSSSSNKKARTESPSQQRPTPAKRGRKPIEKEEISDPEMWGPGGSDSWQPPKIKKDAWEEHIESVETIEPDEHDVKWVFLRWHELDNNGRHRKTKERLHQVYQAAPQAMLKFYERHLVFGKPSAPASDS